MQSQTRPTSGTQIDDGLTLLQCKEAFGHEVGKAFMESKAANANETLAFLFVEVGRGVVKSANKVRRIFNELKVSKCTC